MKPTGVAIAGIAFLLAAQSAFADSHRFAVVIGNNEGLDKSETLKYAQKKKKKIYNLLIELGRFKKHSTSLLLDQRADKVWRALRADKE